jgi:hypothetical protein
MKKYTLLIFGFCYLFVFENQAKTLFVATNGNDTTGTGTITAPYATIMKAHSYVVAGDTVFVRGGTYVMKESQIYSKVSIWAYIVEP